MSNLSLTEPADESAPAAPQLTREERALAFRLLQDDADRRDAADLGVSLEDYRKAMADGRDLRHERELAAQTFDQIAPPLSSVLATALGVLEDRAAGKAKPAPVPWPSLAAHLGGGFWPGLHVLVGNTGSGKSQLAIEATHHAAHAGVPAVYVGLELDYPGIVARLAALEMRRRNPGDHTSWSTLYLGESREALGRMTKAAGELDRLPLRVVAAPPMGWAYQSMRTLVEGMRARHPDGPLLLVLDFLQLVAGGESELRERIGRAAYVGRAAARDFGASVLFVSSTARENYATLGGERKGDGAKALGEGHPSRLVGLGKESGEIEYAADSVLALARDPEEQGRVWCAVAKVRARSRLALDLQGPARDGWISLTFDGTTFSEAPAIEVIR